MMSFFDRLKNRTRPTQGARSAHGDRGIAHLLALVRDRPGDWATENELADAFARAGRIEEAATQLCATADRLAEEGFVAKAQALYKKAVRLQPQNEYAAFRVSELTTARMNQVATLTLPGVPFDAASEDVADAAADDAAALVDERPAAASPPAAELDDAAAAEPTETFEPTAVEAASESPLEIDEPADEPPSAPAPAEKTVEDVLQEAETAAGYGALGTAVKMLLECARAHPERIEVVAALIGIAERAGMDEALADAQARLCDLQCRNQDYQAARATAEALVARFPDDTRHRARLDFIRGEIGEVHDADDASEMEIEIALDALDEPASGADASIDAEFQRALDAVLAWDGSGDSKDALAEARLGLERAASVPRHRTAAARQLAQLDADAGDWASALGWLECAAGGVLTTVEEEELAYEMAVVLERAGDHDRARGVLSEIVAKVGPDYRDVSERMSRLAAPVAAF